MDPNFIGCPRCVSGTSLAPIVTAGIGKELPLRIKGRTRNGSLNRIKRLEPLLVVFRRRKIKIGMREMLYKRDARCGEK